MKKIISIFCLLVLIVFVLSGCKQKQKRINIIFDGKEGKIVFAVKEDNKYKISSDSKEFRTTREQGVLVGKNFKIGIEFSDDLDYYSNGDFEKLKESRKKEEDYKEVTYSGTNGIEYFYGNYQRYDIYLPIKNDKKNVLILTIYGSKDTKESAKKALKSEEVQDILNNIISFNAK